MGKPSTASCLRIIACGGNNDSVDRDDLQAAPEIKGSSDRRGWSFRKRSARHRVLSNSVTSETPPSGNKTSPDSANVSFQTQPSSTAPEKTPVVQWTEEKAQFSTPVDVKVSETPAPALEDSNVADRALAPDDSNVSETPAPQPDDSKVSETPDPAPDVGTTDIAPDESAIIIIQAAIRGSLAQKMLLKHKKVIKLQAAVRGHIVRKHAAGSLRCVQAIIKMQALVRQRRARLLLEELRTKKEDKLGEKNGKENNASTDLGEDNSETKPHVKYTSLKKLLSNRFARQLLESKPRTNINIKCDPSKSDSAWKWLERWMAVSPIGNKQSPQSEITTDHQEEKKLEKLDCQLENEISSQDICESRDIKSSIEVSGVPSEGDKNVISYDSDSFDPHACRPTLSLESHSTGEVSQNAGEAKSSVDALDSLPGEAKESDVVSKTEPDLLLDSSEVENEQHIHQVKGIAPEEPETDGKKNLLGSRKASNPAFLAAQSKFEELTSSADLARSRSVGSSNQDGIDSSTDAISLTREIVPAENSFAHATGVEVVSSECGTELSISSTLDSPDRPEVGAVNDEKETNDLEDGINNSKSDLDLAIDTEVEPSVVERDLSLSDAVEQEKHDNITSLGCENDISIKLPDSNSSQIDQKPDTIETGAKMQLESERSHQVSKYSPETSPISHVTIPESQERPSSQVSMKTRKSSGGKSGSNHRRKLESSGKGGNPTDSNNNSGARNNLEQLPKDQKAAKRRNSFGSTKTDHSDQEPRDSSSSSSLPSFMQATESARAKALANSSPRSSPDVLDKDFSIKKRHSLPVAAANTKQGSPRVQHSPSQTQHGAKGNGIHSPQERKWRR